MLAGKVNTSHNNSLPYFCARGHLDTRAFSRHRLVFSSFAKVKDKVCENINQHVEQHSKVSYRIRSEHCTLFL